MKPVYLVLLLLLFPVAYSLDIDLSVQRSFSVDVLYFSYNNTAGTKSFSTELFNNGSQPYYAQVKLDVLNDNGTVFTGWSDKKALLPGNNGFFSIYWVPKDSGVYTARLRIYYGSEIAERFIDVTADRLEMESVFDVGNARVFNNYIELEVKGAEKDDVAVIPVGYQNGWVFTQRLVKNLDATSRKVLLTYSAPGWTGDLNVYVASKNRNYGTEKVLKIQRDTGIGAWVRNAVFSFLTT